MSEEEKTNEFMIIDDAEEFRAVLQKFLESTFSCKVSSFANGMDALDYAKSSNIDFFFIDLEMDVDGIEVINKLTEMEKYKSTPIFVVTAHDNTDNRLDSICSGATSFVTKPLNFDNLAEQIQLVLDQWDASN